MSSTLMVTLKANEWVWSDEHNAPCRVIETQRLWGQTTCRVWLPSQDTVVRAEAERLKPLSEAGVWSSAGVTYVAAAGRVADALTHDVLLAPIEASVIPLPHQIKALSRAILDNPGRYLP